MNRKPRILHIVLLALVLISLIGCSKDEKDIEDSKPKPIYSFYTNDLWSADRIEVLRSDGTRKSSENLNFILDWLYQVGKLTVTSNSTPEDYNGVAYTITLFNGEEELFSFTPKEINGNEILNNDEYFSSMSSLWESDKLIEIK